MRILAFAFLLFASPALAQQCGCDRPVPVPGQYKILGPDFSDFIDVSVSDGPNGECGGQVLFSHPQSTASLTCQGSQYFGTIAHMSQPILMEGTAATQFLAPGTSFRGVIQRPGPIALVPGEPFTPNYTLDLVSPARTPKCICDQVEGWIQGMKNMQSLYSDPSILNYAQQNNVPGLDNGYQAYRDMNGDDSYQPGALQNSYQHMITRQISTSTSAANDAEVYASSAASTDPVTCHIANGLPRTNNGLCRPSIVMQAIRAHEEVHQARCDQVKTASSNVNGYKYWSNHPPNHALDEQEAYQATLDVLEPWYAQNCS